MADVICLNRRLTLIKQISQIILSESRICADFTDGADFLIAVAPGMRVEHFREEAG